MRVRIETAAEALPVAPTGDIRAAPDSDANAEIERDALLLETASAQFNASTDHVLGQKNNPRMAAIRRAIVLVGRCALLMSETEIVELLGEERRSIRRSLEIAWDEYESGGEFRKNVSALCASLGITLGNRAKIRAQQTTP